MHLLHVTRKHMAATPLTLVHMAPGGSGVGAALLSTPSGPDTKVLHTIWSCRVSIPVAHVLWPRCTLLGYIQGPHGWLHPMSIKLRMHANCHAARSLPSLQAVQQEAHGAWGVIEARRGQVNAAKCVFADLYICMTVHMQYELGQR